MRGQRRTGVKRMHHPVVGDLELTYEAMELPSDPSLTAHPLLRTPGSARRSRVRYTLTGPAAGRVAAARRLLAVLTDA